MIRRRISTTGLVGIDIGACAIKLLQLREVKGQLSVTGAAKIETGSKDDLRQTHNCAEKLRSVMTSGMFIGRRCVVSLPREDVRVQAVRLPSMRDDELAQAAAWEASQRFDIVRENLMCDYVRTNMLAEATEGREEILLVGAAADVVNDRLEPVLQAGFRPVAVDVGFAALARVFSRRSRRENDRDTVRAILDVGYSGSSITIVRGDQVAFSKSIAIGGARFNAIVAEHLQIDEHAAAELRAARIATVANGIGEHHTKQDHSFDPATDRAVYEAIRPLIGNLVKEIVLCMRYYGVTFRGRPPQTIIVTGGDALEPHLAELVEHSCKAQVVFDDESATMAMLQKQIESRVHHDPGPAACWSIAAGLSMRGLALPTSAKKPPTEQSGVQAA